MTFARLFFLSATLTASLLASTSALAAWERPDVTSTLQLTLGEFNPTLGSQDAASYHTDHFTKDATEQSIVLTRYFPRPLLARRWGQLGMRFQLGQWKTQTSAGDSLRVIPLSVGLAYRWDTLDQHYDIPLLGYAGAGVASYLWSGRGAFRLQDKERGNTHESTGAASGTFVALGLALNLDCLALTQNSSRLNSYHTASLYAEWHITQLNNFEDTPSDAHLDLSASQWRFGLTMDF
jgi:hypothetical protein